ncbi:MAG: hypothetical protein QXD55_01630, partial [Candidatus Aenigmatarchaeota archaeon]
MTSPTGNFLPIVQTQEKSFSVEVLANTVLSLEIEESNAKALLLLDNGTALEGKEVKFYLNESFIGSNLTDSQGIAYFFVNSSGILKAVFEGSEYLNPSEALAETVIKENESINLIKPLITSFGLSKDFIYENESLMIYALIENASQVIFEISSQNYSALFNGTHYLLEFSNFAGTYIFSKIYASDVFGNFDVKEANLTFEIKPILEKEIEIKLNKKFFKLGEKIDIDVLLSNRIFNLLENEKKIQGFLKRFKIILIDPQGNETEISFLDLGKNKKVLLDTGRNFKPGLYKIKVIAFEKTVNEIASEIEFGVGLVNVNTPKSIYLPGEEAKIIVGVLDIYGGRVTDADINLTIQTPSGENISVNYNYATNAGDIINKGDGTYEYYFTPTELGIYNISVNATSTSSYVNAVYETFFEVKDFVEFEIERIGPTVIYTTGGNMTIKITPKVDSEILKITEYLPKDWNVSVDNGIILEKEDSKIIAWELKSEKNKPIFLNYTFDPPDISPMLGLLGPLKIRFKNNEFKESREWSVAVDTLYWFYTEWYIRNRYSGNATDELTLCRGSYYNFTILLLELAFDTDLPDASNYNGKLQILPEGGASYSDLPAYGWDYFDGSGNVRTVPGNDLAPTLGCANGADDNCFTHTRGINISSNAPLGNYKLKYTITGLSGYFQEQTNIINVRVIDCKDVNLIRRIKVYGPSGKWGYVIKGHLASIVVPLANYNTSQTISGNVSIKILDDKDNELNWFFWDNKTQSFAIPPSPSAPSSYSQNILLFRFEVPDNAIDITYTAFVEITTNSTTNSYISYYEPFNLQLSDDENKFPVVIFTSPPRAGTADDAAYEIYRFAVCNYGDYNVTNATINVYPFVKGTTAPTVIESVNLPSATSSAELIYWRNVNISTSDCSIAALNVSGPNEAGIEGAYQIEVIYYDKALDTEVSLSKYDSTSLSGGGANGDISGSPNFRFNVTYLQPNTSVSLNYMLHDTGDSSGRVYRLLLKIPPGLNLTYLSRTPDLGYPLGSPYEGYVVSWTTTISTTSGDTVRTISISNMTISTGSIGYFTPGGKVFYQHEIGHGGGRLAKWYTHQETPLILLGSWIKTIRYYNTTSSYEQEGLPSDFGCGNFTTKLQVFNKGNLPANNFNVTENKDNVSVTHPGDLQFSSFNPTPSYYIQSRLINWDGSINFDVRGKDNSKNYSYLISVPYQTNGTFTFFAQPKNSSLTFYDENYTIFIACGASLSVSQPTTTPSTINVNDPFNISSTITNYGPGNATNVISEINYTGNFEVKNITEQVSNTTYVGTLGLTSTTVKWLVNSNGVPPGDYQFCIKANASENSTEVASCTIVSIQQPSIYVALDNPLAISDETGSDTGSWGYNWTFNVTVNSNSESDFNVSAWVSKDGGSTWIFIGNQTYYQGSGSVNLSFGWDPSCSDRPTTGDAMILKFTNSKNSNSSEPKIFYLTKNAIVFESFVGNNSIANRTGEQTTLLGVRIRDKNSSEIWIPNLNITFKVTYDHGVTWDTGAINNTTTEGYAYYYFNPVCLPTKHQVGDQLWRAIIENDNCYQNNDTNTSGIYLNLSVVGDINITFNRPDGSENYTQEDTILFQGYTYDDCGSAIVPTIKFYANNSTEHSYECANVQKIGENVFE